MGLSNPTVTSLCLARPPHLHEDPAQPRESDLVTKATWSTPAGRSANGGGSGAVVPGQGSEALPSAIFIVCPGWAPAHRRGEGGGAVSRQGGRGTKILGKPPAKLDLALPCHYPPPPAPPPAPASPQGSGAETSAEGSPGRKMGLPVAAGREAKVRGGAGVGVVAHSFGRDGQAPAPRAVRCTVGGKAAQLLAGASSRGSRWCQRPP